MGWHYDADSTFFLRKTRWVAPGRNASEEVEDGMHSEMLNPSK